MPTPPHEAARRRRGRIQKAVVRALIAAGGRDVATTDIAKWAYPHGPVWLSNVWRAAGKVAVQVGRRGRQHEAVWRLRTRD